ncbi:MAG: ABC transporter permease [Chelatococcus sp.]|jgi:peptide/nickel transport system permease protein|uniref:ABC transporter permease n=1 Tax=Chelatococcus sp. TaxID=1953771 RepID=UPI0025B93CA8|nr:ABC transporter permease [Chelatococcus sp.]MBX3540791.1 ABC transporter permease [Chelatococcus sp.]
MINYFAQRLGQALIVIFVVAVLAFLMFRFLGDPIVAILGANSTGLQRDALRRELGLDAPLLFQFADYLWQMLRGNFGLSYRLGQPVGQVLLERAPATIELAMSGMLLSLAVGIPAGIYTALHRRRISSQLTLGLSLVGISMPSFFMGILLIFVFSVRLGWLPSFGRGETVSIGWWSTGLLTISGLKALVMPAITISVFQIAMIMRLVRAEMLEVMRMDYIRFARARGLSSRAVHLRHALGNTLVPVITITGLQLGSVIAFAVITEQVFQWPGLGLLFLQSVAAADVPVIAAYLVLIALVFVVINLIVDLLYYVIDPRLQSLITNGSRA